MNQISYFVTIPVIEIRATKGGIVFFTNVSIDFALLINSWAAIGPSKCLMRTTMSRAPCLFTASI